MKELEDCLREALEESPYGIVTNDTALETARKYASELLRQRDELKEAFNQMRQYWSLIDSEADAEQIADSLWEVLAIAEAAIKNTDG
jgi:hypothetical protein